MVISIDRYVSFNLFFHLQVTEFVICNGSSPLYASTWLVLFFVSFSSFSTIFLVDRPDTCIRCCIKREADIAGYRLPTRETFTDITVSEALVTLGFNIDEY
jgi:hypothetical protein